MESTSVPFGFVGVAENGTWTVGTGESSTSSPFRGDVRDLLLQFIRAYRELPLLWDPTSPDYTNREKKNVAYDELLIILRDLKKDAVRDDVKKKINSLRTNFRKELRRVRVALCSGEVYEPTCWTFRELCFLANQNRPNSPGEILSCMATVEMEDEIKEEIEEDTNDALSICSDSGAAHSSEPTPKRMKPIHVTCPSELQTCPPREPQNDPQREPQNDPQREPHNDLQRDLQGNPLRELQTQIQRDMQNDIRRELPGNPTRETQNDFRRELQTDLRRDPQQDPLRELQNNIRRELYDNNRRALQLDGHSYLPRFESEEDIIAKAWALRLKRIKQEQRVYAEKFINDVLLEGELGSLHRNSFKLNEGSNVSFTTSDPQNLCNVKVEIHVRDSQGKIIHETNGAR